MTLKKEYEKQQKYRNWEMIIKKLPIDNNHTVVELGCGTGSFSEILSKNIKEVIAIDKNQNLLQVLQEKNIENIKIIENDISNLNYIEEQVDGIFSSFVIAYFPNIMGSIFNEWIKKLKVGGWFAIIEIENLLRGHQPLSEETSKKLLIFEEEVKRKGVYDFNSGKNIILELEKLNMEILYSEDLEDDELTSQGIVTKEVYTMWEQRLNRLSFNNIFSEEEVALLKQEFLLLLKNPNHINETKVRFIVAKKKA